MGPVPVPEGWTQGERLGEWVLNSAPATTEEARARPITLRLVSPPGHGPEWQVRSSGKLVSTVSDRVAALALAEKLAGKHHVDVDSRGEKMSFSQTLEELMGPVPDGWVAATALGEWVRSWPIEPRITIRLSAKPGHTPEWQVRLGYKLVATVSDKLAALAVAGKLAADSAGEEPVRAARAHDHKSLCPRCNAYTPGEHEPRCPLGAAPDAVDDRGPPAVDPWKAFGLAVLEELKPPKGEEPLVFLKAVCRTAALGWRAAEDVIEARSRADELRTKLDRYANSAPEKMSSLPLEIWHRVTSPQGNCAVLELRTEGGRILSRREVVESDRRDIQLAKVDDLMSRGAKESV